MRALGIVASARVGTDAPPVSGYTGWWDFSDASNVTVSDTDKIDQVSDKSGNGFHLTAPSGARPLLTTSASLGGGTLGVAAFDGSNDQLKTATDPLSGNFTTFAVAVKPDSASVDGLFYQRSLAYYVFSTPDLRMWMGNGAGVVSTSSADWTSSRVHVRLLSGSSQSTWLNKTNKINASVSGSGSSSVFTVGANNGTDFSNWIVGEVVVYSSALSTADRESVTDYLMTKWGIT